MSRWKLRELGAVAAEHHHLEVAQGPAFIGIRAQANVELAKAGHDATPDDLMIGRPPGLGDSRLALQLRFLKSSESMGNHDSNIVDACGVD
jgi:hypothetical protein